VIVVTVAVVASRGFPGLGWRCFFQAYGCPVKLQLEDLLRLVSPSLVKLVLGSPRSEKYSIILQYYSI
jgi:hypothetical protein